MAVIVWAVLILTIQVNEVPEQPPPLQPPKVDGDATLAVKVIVVLLSKSKVQVEPQLMPPGELVTVPLPVPVLFTISVCLLGRLKVAITD